MSRGCSRYLRLLLLLLMLSCPFPLFFFGTRSSSSSRTVQYLMLQNLWLRSDMELGRWVTGSVGHLGHLLRPGHRVTGSLF